MRIVALLRSLKVRDIRHLLVRNVTQTIQAFALLGLAMSSLAIAVAPDLRIAVQFSMLGMCLACAVVYLANELRHEAGTSLWCGAIVSGMLAADLQEPANRLPMFLFAGVCLWLMWYVTPYAEGGPLREEREISEEEANKLHNTTNPAC